MKHTRIRDREPTTLIPASYRPITRDPERAVPVREAECDRRRDLHEHALQRLPKVEPELIRPQRRIHAFDEALVRGDRQPRVRAGVERRELSGRRGAVDAEDDGGRSGGVVPRDEGSGECAEFCEEEVVWARRRSVLGYEAGEGGEVANGEGGGRR